MTILICNILLFGFLAVVWNTNTLANQLLKFCLVVMTVSNGILLANALGYIVKVSG